MIVNTLAFETFPVPLVLCAPSPRRPTQLLPDNPRRAWTAFWEGSLSQLSESEFVEHYSQAHTRLWILASAVIGDANLAEDILQESAITGLRKIDDFDPNSSFIAWMSQIVRFTALNFLKNRNRRKAEPLGVHSDTEPSVEDQPAAQTSVTDAGELFPGQSDFDDDVVRAIEDLDPERRACLLLRTIHSMGYDEIAEVVGIPEGTAMSHVHRAKSAMRKSLTHYRDCEQSSAKGDGRG